MGLFAMRRYILILIFLATLVQDAFCQPNLVNVTWNLTDFTTRPLAMQKFVLTPLAVLGTNGNNILIPGTYSTVLSSGTVTVSNVVTGFAYRVTLADVYGSPWHCFTNAFSNNLTGNVNASTNLGYIPPQVYGYQFLNGSNNAIGPGTNVFLTTNGGVIYINSTGGGGGYGVDVFTYDPLISDANMMISTTMTNGTVINITNSPVILDSLALNSYGLGHLNRTLYSGVNGSNVAANPNGSNLVWLYFGDSTGSDTRPGFMAWLEANTTNGIQPGCGTGNVLCGFPTTILGSQPNASYWWGSATFILNNGLSVPYDYQNNPGSNFFTANRFQFWYMVSASNGFATLNFNQKNSSTWTTYNIWETPGGANQAEGTLACTNIPLALTNWQCVLSNASGSNSFRFIGGGLYNTNAGAGALIYDLHGPGQDLGVWLGMGSNNIACILTNIGPTVIQYDQIKCLYSYTNYPAYLSYVLNTNLCQADIIIGDSQISPVLTANPPCSPYSDPPLTSYGSQIMRTYVASNLCYDVVMLDYYTAMSCWTNLAGLGDTLDIAGDPHLNSQGWNWKWSIMFAQLHLRDIWESCGQYHPPTVTATLPANGSFSSLIVAPGNYEGLYEGVFTPLGFGGAIWAGYNTNGSQNNATNYMIAGYTLTGVGLTSVNAQTDLELGVGERTLTHYYNSTGIEIGPNIADPGAGNLDVRDHAVFDSDVTFSNRVTFNGQIIGNISATNLPLALQLINTNNGVALTNLNAGSLTGTLPLATLPSAVLTNGLPAINLYTPMLWPALNFQIPNLSDSEDMLGTLQFSNGPTPIWKEIWSSGVNGEWAIIDQVNSVKVIQVQQNIGPDFITLNGAVIATSNITAVAVTANIAASTNAAGNSPLFSTNNSPFNAGGLTNLNAAKLIGTATNNTTGNASTATIANNVVANVLLTNPIVTNLLFVTNAGSNILAVTPKGTTNYGALTVGNLTSMGAISTDAGQITSDGNGDLYIANSFRTDGASISTDGTGDLTAVSVTATSASYGALTAGTLAGNGSGLTNLNAASLVGIATNNTTGNASTATLASAVTGTLTNAVTNFSAVPGAGTNNNVLTWSGGQAAFAGLSNVQPSWGTNIVTVSSNVTLGPGTNVQFFTNYSATASAYSVDICFAGACRTNPLSCSMGHYSFLVTNTANGCGCTTTNAIVALRNGPAFIISVGAPPPGSAGFGFSLVGALNNNTNSMSWSWTYTLTTP
jgi:hypothetical protein